MQVSGREVFEFRPELVDDDDAEADDTQYANNKEDEEEEEEVNIKSFNAFRMRLLHALPLRGSLVSEKTKSSSVIDF